MTQITEAQRLAAWHKKAWYSVKIAWDTAAELRRLEAANAELVEAIKAEMDSAWDCVSYHPKMHAAIKKHGGAA